MSKVDYYHITMVIRKEEEVAIKSVFKDKHWPCHLKVLSEETVADIIKNGFTDIFPVVVSEESHELTMDTKSEDEHTDNCADISNDVVMATGDNRNYSEARIESKTTKRRIVPTRKSSRRKMSVLQGSDEKQSSRVYKKKGRSKAQQGETGNQSIIQCIDCKLKFNTRKEFWSHRNHIKHQLPTVNIPTKYNLEVYSKEEHEKMGFIKCDGCENFFLGKRRQMKHFYVVHRDLMPTPTCPICCKEFEAYAELLKHKREEGHRDSLSSLNNYQCDLCGKHMTSYSNFVQHKQFVCGIGEKEMEKIRIHKCDLCGKLFKSPRHVRRHKKICHFKVPEMCDICGTLCQGRKALDVHKKRHDDKNKKHVCSDCGKAFFSDSKLQEHIRTHTKEKPFKCPLCTYTCAVKPNIHKHAMNVHKQTVSAVDLRKTQVTSGSTMPESTPTVQEVTRNPQGNGETLLCIKAVPDNNNCNEMSKVLIDNYHANFEYKANSSTMNNSTVGQYQLNVDNTCTSSPVSQTNSVSFVVPHKNNSTGYNVNELNTDMHVGCGGAEIVYYSEREEKRAEYLAYPHTDIYNHINVSQY